MNIEINTEQLNADIGRVDSELSVLESSAQRVYTCLENLNNMWEGTANASFRTQVANDHMIFIEMMDNLKTLVECMEYARDEYGRCRDEVNEKIASVRISDDT